MKKFEFNLMEEKKELGIKVNGFFDEKDGMEFINTYKKTVGELSNPKDFKLSLDCKKLNVTKADLVNTLAGCMKMYTQDFNDICFILDKSQIILNMQLKRLMRENNIQNKIMLVEN